MTDYIGIGIVFAAIGFVIAVLMFISREQVELSDNAKTQLDLTHKYLNPNILVVHPGCTAADIWFFNSLFIECQQDTRFTTESLGKKARGVHV